MGLDGVCIIVWPFSVNLMNCLLFCHFLAFNCDENWIAHNDKTCAQYETYNYCKKDGDHYGSAWQDKWGKFEGWADNEGRSALVCPQCGCQGSTSQPVKGEYKNVTTQSLQTKF